MGAGLITLYVLALLGALSVARFFFALAAPRVRETPQKAAAEQFRELSPGERARALARHANAPILGGNRIELLVNGDRIFPALLEAIGGARDTIDFLTFVYWRGQIARDTAAALAAAARRGVEVRVLLDAFGALQMEPELIDAMRDAGCRVAHFNPLRWFTLARYNFRTHRKILVVDGTLGFTGGVGIADEWTGDAQDADHWRDDHFRVRGPAVEALQGAFAQNWRAATGETLAGDRFFPPCEPAGDATVVSILGEPRRASDVEFTYWFALAGARRQVEIATPYFIPRRNLLGALVRAARRGVQVRLLVPGGHNDSMFVRRVSRVYYRDLIDAGVRVFEYRPTMMHAKAITADDDWAVIGSANFDNRSFELNYESNLTVIDPELTAALRAAFERDLERAVEIGERELAAEAAWKTALGRLLLVLRRQL